MTSQTLAEVLAEVLHSTETTGGWWGRPECEEFGRLVAPAVTARLAAILTDPETVEAVAEAMYADEKRIVGPERAAIAYAERLADDGAREYAYSAARAAIAVIAARIGVAL